MGGIRDRHLEVDSSQGNQVQVNFNQTQEKEADIRALGTLIWEIVGLRQLQASTSKVRPSAEISILKLQCGVVYRRTIRWGGMEKYNRT